MLSPSPGAQTAHSGGCRKVGSSVTTVAASTISRPGPASGAPSSAPQDSEPDQVTGSPGNSASSRRYSSVAIARSPAAGPVRAPDAPTQGTVRRHARAQPPGVDQSHDGAGPGGVIGHRGTDDAGANNDQGPAHRWAQHVEGRYRPQGGVLSVWLARVRTVTSGIARPSQFDRHGRRGSAPAVLPKGRPPRKKISGKPR